MKLLSHLKIRTKLASMVCLSALTVTAIIGVSSVLSKSRMLEDQILGTAAQFVSHAIAQEVFRDVKPGVLIAIVWGSFRAMVQGGCDGRLSLDDETCTQAEQCIWEAIRR
jgi:hypothetical protein